MIKWSQDKERTAKAESQEVMKMMTLKVTFSDGDELVTRINFRTEQEARNYYIGKTFNTGSISDNMVKAVSVEILEQEVSR